MVYETKTKENDASVRAFIDALPDERKRADTLILLDLFERMSGYPAKMWGPSIIGFGRYHYKYDSGHEGDMCRTGFSPRKANIALYGIGEHQSEPVTALLAKLGKHKAGKGCLYVNRLSDVDIDVLGELIRVGLAQMDAKYPR